LILGRRITTIAKRGFSPSGAAMFKRLVVLGVLLAVPGSAHAQLQLRIIQQQQLWRLQQQERQARAQQDERLQQDLLQPQIDTPQAGRLAQQETPQDRMRDLQQNQQFQLQQQQQQLQLMQQQQQQQLLQQHLMQQQQNLNQLQQQSPVR
jgi:hypothetical protein